jgi:hypothetical protein
VGYRYKCSKCANHDVCEACYDDFCKGVVNNKLNEQKLSSDVNDHAFKMWKDKSYKGLIKTASSGPTQASSKKCKPNDPCSCGSGKKFKKCCGTGAA